MGFGMESVIDPISLPVQFVVDLISLSVQFVVDPISLPVQFAVDPISLPVQPVRRSMAPIISGPVGSGMELIIDLVSPVIQSLYNTVTDVLLNSLLG